MGTDYKVLFTNTFSEDLLFTNIFHPVELQRINSATNQSVRLQRANAYSLLKSEHSHWVDHLKSGVPILMINETRSKFSISLAHKENAVAVVIASTSENYIGIDLETLNTNKNFNFLNKTIIDDQEESLLKLIANLYNLNLNDAPLFFWTLKEAAYKALSGNVNIFDLKILLDDENLILKDLNLNLIFLFDVFIVNENIIAVVTTKKLAEAQLIL